LAFFAFAQAASARNGAQSAADAAALAAAQQAREDLLLDLGDAVEAGDDWLDWLDLSNGGLSDEGATAAAQQLAAANESTVLGGAALTEVNGYPGFAVEVQTGYTVGETIIPGTESMTATARATAIIQPRCDFALTADPTKPVTLDCDGQSVDIDPGNFDPDDLPDASVMFSVRLAE
jgi:hypothetical protein